MESDKILTTIKDLNILILSKLSFADLRNVLVVNKTTSKYNSNVMWLNYQIRDSKDFDIMKTVIKRSWKEFSLLLIKYLKLSKDFYSKAMYLAARQGDRDVVDFFILKGIDSWDYSMRGAAKGGHRDLVDFFISKGAYDWNWAISGAAQGGHRDLVDFLSQKVQTNGQMVCIMQPKEDMLIWSISSSLKVLTTIGIGEWKEQ